MRKQGIKKGMSVLSAFIIGFTTVAGLMGSGITSKAATTNISNPRIADDGTVTWDKVTFGSYYQDMNEMVAEPIKWRILSVNEDGTDAFLLADKGLDCKPYNSVGVQKTDSSGNVMIDYSSTWKNCTLRNWLNGTFYNTAFNTTEQNAIITTTVVNDDTTSDGSTSIEVEGNDNTDDKVYLLSKAEASNTQYGFDKNIFNSASNKRAALLTDYAYVNGAYCSAVTSDGGNCKWWLRTPQQGIYNGRTMLSSVNESGSGDYDNNLFSASGPGILKYINSNVVRPVIHVDLTKECMSNSYAGTIRSDGNGNEVKNQALPAISSLNPVVDEDSDVVTWSCVYIGNYKQNATFDKSSIEWRVLSVDGDYALLLADKALYAMKYYEGDITPSYLCTWKTSTVRAWLNNEEDSNSFINNAFSSSEKNLIKLSTVKEENLDTNGGENLKDKVYILSKSEATNIAYGFDEVCLDISDESTKEQAGSTRNVMATDYAYINGARLGDGWLTAYYSHADKCKWWLRSSTRYSEDADYIKEGYFCDSYIEYYESPSVKRTDCGVRPVIQVNLSEALNSGLLKVCTDKATAKNQTIADAYNVDNLISAIGTVTLESKSKIDAARTAYNELYTKESKNKVTKYDVLTAAEAKYAELEKQDKEDTANAAKVDELISAIGEVTLDSKSKITDARTAYDALTSGARNKVTKYDVLTAAETKLAELETKKASTDNNGTTEAPKTDATTEASATTEEKKTEITDAQMKKTTPAVATVKEEKTKKGKASINIKWKTVNGANGYKVYRSTKKNKGYKCVKTIKKAVTKSWKDTGVKTGKTYYYKMRAYKKSGKKTIYSKYSSTKKISVK